MIDEKIVRALENSGVNFFCSVPCTLLSGILQILSEYKGITHIPVTREEEGIGICAGAYLGGARPALLMQNSGLGNSINALLSLTTFYKLPLILILGYRGRPGEEKVEAQIPMGKATKNLLSIIAAETKVIEREAEIPEVEDLTTRVYQEEKIGAVLLTPKLWQSDN